VRASRGSARDAARGAGGADALGIRAAHARGRPVPAPSAGEIRVSRSGGGGRAARHRRTRRLRVHALLRPRLQLGWRLPRAWSAEARAQFYFDLRDAPYRRDDTLILEAEAGRGVGRNLQVLFGGGWRLYGDQGYRWGLDATLRWLFR